MPSRLLPVPKPGETITVLVAAGADPYVLDFDPSTATATQVGKNLVITLENGGRVIFQDFFDTPDATPPVFLAGDQEVPWDALQPAAEAQQTVALRDGSSQDFTNSTLMQGIAALDGLDLSGNTTTAPTTPLMNALTDTGTDATAGQAATGTTNGTTGGSTGDGGTTLPPLNTPPTVDPAFASLTEDLAITATGQLPRSRDINVEDMLTFLPKINEAGIYGSLGLLSDGTYTYTLNNNAPAVQGLSAGQSLTERFTYTVTDGQGGTASNTLTITVRGTNDAPIVAAATASITEGVQNTIVGTLPTPQDVDTGDVVTYVPKTETGVYGSLTVLADGSYTFSLNGAATQGLGAGQTFTETYTYTVSDGQGGTASNTLTITVRGTNDAPTVAAATAAVAVTEDTLTTITATLPMPLDADSGDVVTFIPKVNEAGTYGSLTLQADGTYTYTLNNNAPAGQSLGVGQSATETFTYTVSDGLGGTATNTLTITVKGTNDAPTVAAATASITEGVQNAIVGTLPTPQDVDTGDVVTYVPKTETGVYGSLTVLADGSYTFSLNGAATQGLGAGQTFTETYTYTVSDGQGGTASNTLTITVRGTNDAPTVAAATATVTEDTLTTITATLPTPQDIDTGDVVTFIPKVNEAGTYGSLTLQADGTYTYTLNSNAPAVQSLGVRQSVTETFTYIVSDGQGGTATNTLTITVKGTNDAPTVATATAIVTEDTHVTITATLPMPHDVDTGDVATFIPKANEVGTYGSLTLQANGTYTYTLNNNDPMVQSLGVGQSVTETFTYTVTDGQGEMGTNTLTITVRGTNDAPTVAAATAIVTEDTRTTITATLPTPLDVDAGDVVTFIPTADEVGSYGSLTLQTNGTYTYTLNNNAPAVQSLGAGQSLTETFTYTVTDGQGGMATNTLTITLKGTNDAPTVAAATAAVTEDTHTTITATLPMPHDVDTSDVVTFIPKTNEAGTYGSLTLQANGTYTYTLNNNAPAVQSLGAGQCATETFTYTVSDGNGGYAVNTLTITINGTNDKPLPTAATAQVTEDLTLTATGNLPATDPDSGDRLTFTPLSLQGQYGSLTLDSQGHYIYTLNNASSQVQALGKNALAMDSFTYTVMDNHGASASNTLTLTVNGVNDAPTLASVQVTAKEDTFTVVQGALTAQDVDAGDTLAFLPKVNEPGLYGSLTLGSNGSYIYTLNNASPVVQGLGVGDTLTETFFVVVRDQNNALAHATLNVTINGTNDAPVAQAFTAAVTEDLSTTVAGRLWATDPDNTLDGRGTDTVSFEATTLSGRYGNLVLQADGSYTYTLNNSLGAVQGLTTEERLSDVFTYTVRDNYGATSTNTLTVVVNGNNDNPITQAATATMQQNSPSTLYGCLPQPTDPDNTKDGVVSDTLHFVPIVNGYGTYGTLQMDASGNYSYTLNTSLPAVRNLKTGDSVRETFNYAVQDDHGGVSVNTFTLTILNPEDCKDDEDHRDDEGASSSGLLFALTLDVTEDVVLQAQTKFKLPLGLPLIGRTIEGDYGTLTINPNGSCTYVLHNELASVQGLGAGDSVVDHFTYLLSGLLGTVEVTVRGTNDAPQAQIFNNIVSEDRTLVATGSLRPVVDKDSGDTHIFSAQSSLTSQYGTLYLTDNGNYVYVLNTAAPAVQALGAGQTVVDSFTYRVADSASATAQGTLRITVQGNNDNPVVADASLALHEDTGGAHGVLPTPTDVDTEDRPVYVAQELDTAFGHISITANGSYTYVLSHDAVQSLGTGQTAYDNVAYTVSDGRGGTATAHLSITIHGDNDAPTVAAATARVTEDSQLTAYGQLPHPVDPDANDIPAFTPMNYVLGLFGSLDVRASGVYTYTLNNDHPQVQALGQGEQLTEVFTYTVSDGHGGTATNTLTMIIQGSNDTPTVGAAVGAGDMYAFGHTPQSLVGTLPAAQDVDTHDAHSYSLQGDGNGQYGTLVVHDDGSYSYTPHANSLLHGLSSSESVTETFRFSVSDGHGGVAENTLTLTVKGINDAPLSGVTQLAVAQEDGPAIHGTLPLPNDPDNMGGTLHDQLSFTPQSSAGQFGSLVLHSDGSYTYTLNNSLPAVQALGEKDTLSESFHCQVSDGKGGFATTTLEITVQGATEPVSPVVTLTPSPTPESSLAVGAGDMGGSTSGTGSGADSTTDADMQEQLLQLSIQNGN